MDVIPLPPNLDEHINGDEALEDGCRNGGGSASLWLDRDLLVDSTP